MRSQFKDCYNCAIETMQVLNKIYNQKKNKTKHINIPLKDTSH